MRFTLATSACWSQLAKPIGWWFPFLSILPSLALTKTFNATHARWNKISPSSRHRGLTRSSCHQCQTSTHKAIDTFVTVEGLSSRLCGVSRPGHFRGVTTVVLKLFNIVRPHRAVFGQKDAQQTIILSRMVRDLNLDVELIIQPIVREADGLALSSRNQYLNPKERRAATVLSRSLDFARQASFRGECRAHVLLQGVRERIESEPLARLEYVEIVSADDLSPLQKVTDHALLAMAVFIGETRLIDNTFLHKSPVDSTRSSA